MGKEVNEVINNICDKLGYAASEITPEMAKYMIAKDTFTIITCCVLMVVSIIGIIVAVRHCRKMLDKYHYYEGVVIFGVIATIGILTTAVVAVSTGIDLVGWLASPKASMVEYVLTAIK